MGSRQKRRQGFFPGLIYKHLFGAIILVSTLITNDTVANPVFPPGGQHEIVRVVVTSSVSSSSSSSSTKPRNLNDNSTTNQSNNNVNINHTANLKTMNPYLVVTTIPTSTEKPVEDIFSAFYNVFSKEKTTETPISFQNQNLRTPFKRKEDTFKLRGPNPSLWGRAIPLTFTEHAPVQTSYHTTEKSWGEPEKVWGQPEKVWGEPAKIWGEPAKNWGIPEQNWYPSTTESSPTTTTTTELITSTKGYVNLRKRRRPKIRRLGTSAEPGDGLFLPQVMNPNENGRDNKFGYVLEGADVRRYRVEERTPDGFIVGEYGVLNHDNRFLRGVRYTADGTINPSVIHDALMKFLAL